MLRTEIRTKVIMDNGTAYEFPEPVEQFLRKVYDFRTSQKISAYLKGEKFYINTDHIAAIEEVQNIVKEDTMDEWELNRLSAELKKVLEEKQD